MRPNLAGPFVACLLVAFSLAGCAMEPVIHTAPPPDREEAASGARPSPDHFWVRGNWRWDGQAYTWAPGHWEAGRADARYVQGHWRNISGGWVWLEGHWVPR